MLPNISENENKNKIIGRKWVQKSKIASGCYGDVYLGVDSLTNEIIAIKKIKILSQEDGVSIEILRETTILRNMDHPNIIQ